MAIKEKLDSKKGRSLGGRFSRATASGVNDKSIFGLYRQELWKNRPSFEFVLFGSVFTGFVGSMGGGIYADLIQDKAVDTNISYGIEATELSYQGMGDYLLQYQAEDGTYAIFNPNRHDGKIVEFEYETNMGDVVGVLYNMRIALTQIVADHELGNALSAEQRAYFFLLNEITVLHEEESETVERDFSNLERGDTLTDAQIAQRAQHVLPFVNQAFDSILEGDENKYGISTDDLNARPNYVSVDEGIRSGLKKSFTLLASLMALSTMIGAGSGASRRMRWAKEDNQKQKKPSLF